MAVIDNKDATIYLAQEKLAEWAGIIVTSSVRTSKRYQDKAETLRYYLHAIQYEQFLEEEEIVAILQCIEKLAQITEWPTAPVLTEKVQPNILVGVAGPAGTDGAAGADGSDADIDVISDPAYDNMSVVESTVLGVKTYSIAYAPYTEPMITVTLTTAGFPNPSSYVQELGQTISTVPFNSTITKGREEVTAAEVLAPGALDTAFQAILDLPTINGSGSQLITVNDTNVSSDTTYTTEVDDGTNQPTASRILEFVIPFLTGSSATLLVQATYVGNLTKVIEKQGNKSVLFNGTDEYFYFVYDATYPDLTSILDGNGFEAISAFTKTTENIDMLSGTESMKVYKTAITDIPNQTYQFKF